MKIKLCVIVLMIICGLIACVSAPKNLKWDLEDFQEYDSPTGSKTFELDYIVISLDFLTSQYAHFFDDRVFFQSLPVNEIAQLLEEKYDIDVDVSFFNQSLKQGKLMIRGEKVSEYQAEELGVQGPSTGGPGLIGIVEGEIEEESWLWRQTFRGGKVLYHYDLEHLKIPKAGDFMYIIWGGDSGLYRPVHMNWNWIGNYGKTNQMQILIYVDEPKSVDVTIRLCIPTGAPNDLGYYTMNTAVEYSFAIYSETFEAETIEMDTIKDAVKQTDRFLAEAMK